MSSDCLVLGTFHKLRALSGCDTKIFQDCLTAVSCFEQQHMQNRDNELDYRNETMMRCVGDVSVFPRVTGYAPGKHVWPVTDRTGLI